MGYKYETHLHTKQGSACGKSSGAEHVRFYKELGYTGVIVTDHFFGGNTAAPRTGSWRERIDIYCSGYEEALIEGQKLGIQVFFGWEETHDRDDYIVYGLDKAWMIAHPEMEHWTRRQQYEVVRAAGGCVVQAHPFRKRDYIETIHVGNRFADAIEIANGGNAAGEDVIAMHYAKKHGLYVTAGSDHHNSANPYDPQKIFGVELDAPLSSIHDYVSIILNRKPMRLICPDDRHNGEMSEYSLNNAFILDENENDVPMDPNTFCEKE